VTDKEKKDLFKYMQEQIFAGNFDLSDPSVLGTIDFKNLKMVNGAFLIMKDFVLKLIMFSCQMEYGILGHLCKNGSTDVMKSISKILLESKTKVAPISVF
jgi:hypothetical protein